MSVHDTITHTLLVLKRNCNCFVEMHRPIPKRRHLHTFKPPIETRSRNRPRREETNSQDPAARTVLCFVYETPPLVKKLSKRWTGAIGYLYPVGPFSLRQLR